MLLPLAIILLTGPRNIGARVAFGLLAGAALWSSLDLVAAYFLLETPEDVLSKAEFLGRGFGEANMGGSTLEYGGYGSFSGMAAFLPLGIFTALFRPLPGEALSIFGFLASLENMVSLGLLWLAIKRTRWEELKEPVVMWALLFVVTWAAVYAFVSGYNLGTASRYRLQILPIMICLLVHLSRRRLPVQAFIH